MNAVHPQEEQAGLQAELSRLARENEALRESARIWIRMYERRLARSNVTGSELSVAGASL
ncbi:MAG TPA: hypothetical protein VHJ77_13995 [Vicinamibacterales bacterium]|jgi:hypothetical protein|nr:hypothetical protein [Vicinamibacterales bacterium]